LGNKPHEQWGYIIAIMVLAVIFLILLPVMAFLYMDIRTERMLIESNVRKIEKLKKEIESEREK